MAPSLVPDSSSSAPPGRLVPVIVGVVTVTALVVVALSVTGMLWGEGEDLFLDVYETAGSRLASVGSTLGVLLWTVAASVTLFGAWVSRRQLALRQWSRFLAASGLLTALLLADDYLGLHEIGGEMASEMPGFAASTLLRNGTELVGFGVLGLVVGGYLIAFRALLVRTELPLLVLAGIILGSSLAIDMLPRSWPLAVGVPVWVVDLAEDAAKLLGIAMWTTYCVRTTASVVRRAPS